MSDEFRFQCMPYSAKSVAPMVLCLLGFVFFTAAANSCASFQLNLNDFDTQLKYGAWKIQRATDDDECIEWSETILDENGGLKVTKAFGVLGGIMGGLLFLWSISPLFLVQPTVMIKIMGFSCIPMAILSVLIMAGLFQCAEFEDAGFEDPICLPGPAGYLFLPSVICWSVACCLILKFIRDPKEAPARKVNQGSAPASTTEEEGNAAIETTIEHFSDGSKKTTSVTTAADGTKTIKETIEKPSIEVSEEP